MISLVNGYICKSCTDVAEALQGKKPPAKAGELPYSSGSEGKISAFAERQVTRADSANDPANAQSNAQAGASTSFSYGALQSDAQGTIQAAGGLQASGASSISASGINLLV